MAYTGSTAAIMSNYDEAFKTYYLDAIQEQLNHDTFLSDILGTNERDMYGKEAKFAAHYGRTGGIGARADGGALPEADYQKHVQITLGMKRNYGRITFSGPTLAATRDARGTYAEVVDTEIMGCVRDFKKDLNRQLWGCGYGILGRWRSTASGTSYTIQKKYRGNSAGGDGFGSTFGSKYLSDEWSHAVPVVQTFSSGLTASTVDATDIAITAVTEGTDYDTITCTDPSVTEAAGTFYVRPGNMVSLTSASTAGAGRLEMMGLRGIVTNTDLDDIAFTDGTASNTGFAAASAPAADTLQGMAVASYSWWKAKVDAHPSGRYAGQRPLTTMLMQKMFDKIEAAVGQGYGPNLVISTQAMRREYLDVCQRDNITVNTMQLDGGWTALDYNGIPFMVDLDAIDGEIYFLSTQYLDIFRMSDFEWMQKDGAILSRITGYDAYEAVLFRYAEMGCRRRNAQGVLCDLSYSL